MLFLSYRYAVSVALYEIPNYRDIVYSTESPNFAQPPLQNLPRIIEVIPVQEADINPYEDVPSKLLALEAVSAHNPTIKNKENYKRAQQTVREQRVLFIHKLKENTASGKDKNTAERTVPEGLVHFQEKSETLFLEALRATGELTPQQYQELREKTATLSLSTKINEENQTTHVLVLKGNGINTPTIVKDTKDLKNNIS